MCARVMWNVDVTTTTECQPRARASRATALASPRVLYGTAVKHTTRAPAYRCVAHSRSRLRPVLRSLHGREREHRGDSAPDQRQRGRQAPLAPGEHDDHVGVSRGRRLRRRPDEEDEAGDEPGRDEAGDDEQQAAQHGATVPSAPVSGVLFTCAGQRVDIVTAFKRAGARTVATDVNRLAPALYHADAHAFVPRVDDPQYVPTLRALVHEHDISLIVPLTDLDHGVLSRAKDELGALVLLPEPAIVDALADKWLAHLLFEELGIGSPPTWLPGDLPADLEFPVLVKARHGFGSRGIYRCEDARELEFFLGYTTEDSMVQSGLPRRGVLDRRLLRSRPALPQRRSAHDDRVEGRRVDQGDDDRRPGADRGGAVRLRDGRPRRARRTSSASASPTARTASPTSIRASAAHFRCRPPPAAAIRSSRSPSPPASGRSRGSAISAPAST